MRMYIGGAPIEIQYMGPPLSIRERDATRKPSDFHKRTHTHTHTHTHLKHRPKSNI